MQKIRDDRKHHGQKADIDSFADINQPFHILKQVGQRGNDKHHDHQQQNQHQIRLLLWGKRLGLFNLQLLRVSFFSGEEQEHGHDDDRIHKRNDENILCHYGGLIHQACIAQDGLKQHTMSARHKICAGQGAQRNRDRSVQPVHAGGFAQRHRNCAHDGDRGKERRAQTGNQRRDEIEDHRQKKAELSGFIEQKVCQLIQRTVYNGKIEEERNCENNQEQFCGPGSQKIVDRHAQNKAADQIRKRQSNQARVNVEFFAQINGQDNR